MKLRSTLLHKKALRMERVTKGGAKEGCPHPLEELVEGVRRDPQGVIIQHRRHVSKQLCRWLQPKWEICIILGYLTRYILKMMSGRLELWNRKVIHFLATRHKQWIHQFSQLQLMAATAPTHRSASFSQPRLLDWEHTQVVLRGLAALLLSQMNGIFLMMKGGIIFPA